MDDIYGRHPNLLPVQDRDATSVHQAWRRGVGMLCAVVLWAGLFAARSAEPPSTAPGITRVAPGIWRLRFGHPETLTPTHFRSAPVNLEALQALPPGEPMPLEVNQIDCQISGGGCAVALPMG